MKRRKDAVAALVLGVLVGGCEAQSPATGTDASARADAGTAPGPAEIPWLEEGAPSISPATLTPCPAGWREVPPETPEGVPTCDPYPATGAEDCSAGRAHFAGEPGCTPIGRPCPAGEWPVGLEPTGVLYVRAGAATGGDGSLGAPYGTIASALAAAPAGTTIALAKGVYTEVLRVVPGVTVIGACAAETRIAPSSLGTSVAALSASRIGLAIVRDVGVVGSPGNGVTARGAGVRLEVDGVEIASATAVGIVVDDGARLVARNIAVRDTRPTTAGLYGRGLDVWHGSQAEVSRAVFERNREDAIYVEGVDAVLQIADAVVRDTRARLSDDRVGWGLGVKNGATAEVSRTLFERNRTVSVIATGAGASLQLTDVVVRDTQDESVDRTGGRGVSVENGATANANRILCERNREFAFFASDASSRLTVTDAVARDTLGRLSDGLGGRAIVSQRGASVDVTRAYFNRNHDISVYASAAGTLLRLTSVVVRDTLSRDDGTGGLGAYVQTGARLEASAVVIERSLGLGILGTDEGTTLMLTDLVVRDTESDVASGTFGRALTSQEGAHVEVTRAVFERSREFALCAVGASLRLSDVVVRSIRLPSCAMTGCGTFPRSAVGIGAYESGDVVAERFDVDGSELCGVQVARNGALALSVGIVRANNIGACVQVDGYDVSRLTDRVTYVANGTSIATTSLPVPDVVPPI